MLGRVRPAARGGEGRQQVGRPIAVSPGAIAVLLAMHRGRQGPQDSGGPERDEPGACCALADASGTLWTKRVEDDSLGTTRRRGIGVRDGGGKGYRRVRAPDGGERPECPGVGRSADLEGPASSVATRLRQGFIEEDTSEVTAGIGPSARLGE